MSLTRKPAGVELIDLLDRVLDKGIVVDASSRLHLSHANLLKHRKHVVIASIETHLNHTGARAVTKLARQRPLESQQHGSKASGEQPLPDRAKASGRR